MDTNLNQEDREDLSLALEELENTLKEGLEFASRQGWEGVGNKIQASLRSCQELRQDLNQTQQAIVRAVPKLRLVKG